jgi:hypothetical protein
MEKLDEAGNTKYTIELAAERNDKWMNSHERCIGIGGVAGER